MLKRLFCLSAALAVLTLPQLATAHGNVSCNVPKAERKPMLELQKTMKKQGWTVRKVQEWNGCYEIYGYDDKDKPVEAYFDPKTFQRLQESMEAFVAQEAAKSQPTGEN